MSDEIFDPEIHAADKDGNPSLNKDGTFRKKRRDAGTPASSRTRTRTRTRSTGGAPREKYHKAVADFLALPVAGLSMADPVLGYAAASVAPAWSDALADLAVERPQMAAVLEKLGGVGAVGGVLGVAIMTGIQFGHLLGRVPEHVATGMGCKTRSEIETILRQRGEALARQRPAEPAPEHARAGAEGGARVMAGV